jgi:hypothetical protein
MPLINYLCECKKTVSKFFRQAKDAPAFFTCPDCKKDTLKKQLSSPSSLSKIVVDNGVQARAVEIIPNIVELNEERSNKDYREE